MGIRWDAPGPGAWVLDRSHYPGGTTPISEWLMVGCAVGMRKAFAELGMPADALDVRFVNGFMYSRLRPLISPDRASSKLPPKPVLRVALRLHPEMRRRAKRAARSMTERPWRDVFQNWNDEIRPRLERENAELQEIELSSLDMAELGAHIDRMLDRCRDTFALHFYLHVFDLGPIGLLLAACEGWGIDGTEVIPALEGASPSTSAPAQLLCRLRALVVELPRQPTSISELRGASPEIGRLVDDYLALRGRMLVTRYDLDGATLEEQPSVLLATILEGAEAQVSDERVAALTESLRSRVPEAHRAEFDERLTEARASMDLRDDNGPNTVELPVGILRHALLELGDRLVDGGRLTDRRHVFELRRDEVLPTAAGRGPDATELARRAADRQRLSALDPPARLGAAEAEPPLDLLAPAHQQLVGAVQAVLTHMGMSSDGPDAPDPLAGAGVGDKPYEGIARVAPAPEDALAAMEPGDVLVVRCTTPAYNTVLMLAGAVVTAEGALLSHAAVMARELGIPAVIGAPGALSDIPDGARVEVDPTAGTVRVVASVS